MITNLDSAFMKEKEATKEALEDVMRLLSHDTSSTRQQLAEVLRQRAELIESEAHLGSLSEFLEEGE